MADRLFTSARVTEPDEGSLRRNLQSLDATASLLHEFLSSTYLIGKSTAWSGGQITAAQGVIDNAPAATPQLAAQTTIDALPIEWKALALALIDQLNVIRGLLPIPLGAITPAQAIAAIRAKAGTL